MKIPNLEPMHSPSLHFSSPSLHTSFPTSAASFQERFGYSIQASISPQNPKEEFAFQGYLRAEQKTLDQRMNNKELEEFFTRAKENWDSFQKFSKQAQEIVYERGASESYSQKINDYRTSEANLHETESQEYDLKTKGLNTKEKDSILDPSVHASVDVSEGKEKYKEDLEGVSIQVRGEKERIAREGNEEDTVFKQGFSAQELGDFFSFFQKIFSKNTLTHSPGTLEKEKKLFLHFSLKYMEKVENKEQMGKALEGLFNPQTQKIQFKNLFESLSKADQKKISEFVEAVSKRIFEAPSKTNLFEQNFATLTVDLDQRSTRSMGLNAAKSSVREEEIRKIGRMEGRNERIKFQQPSEMRLEAERALKKEVSWEEKVDLSIEGDSKGEILESFLEQVRMEQKSGLSFENQAQNLKEKQDIFQTLQGQLLEKAKIILKENNQAQIRLILNPASLGNIKMDLDVQGNLITGRITVAHEAIKEILESHLSELAENFKSQMGKEMAFDISYKQRDDLEQGQWAQKEQSESWGRKEGKEEGYFGKSEYSQNISLESFISADNIINLEV